MSNRIETIRTTAFRLTDEHFGTVHVYRPGDRFARVWGDLERNWRDRGSNNDFTKPPYRGLATALRVLTGDFVALERRADNEHAFIVSRKPISVANLKIAIGAWEARACGDLSAPVSRVVDDLRVEEVRVADLVRRRPGLCPTLDEGWVWDVGVWEVAHRLAASPMRTDKSPVRWRLDSDAALLSWDHLLHVPNKDDAAMHKLTLHLITVPGVEDPVLSIQASLVRLAPAWRFTGGARYAWADLSPTAPILRGRVRNKPTGDGGFMTEWDHGAAEVLLGASLDPLPSLAGEPIPTGKVRTGFASQPRTNPFGRGVGTWFHECVAHHARDTLGAACRPLTLGTRRGPMGVDKKSARLPLGLDQPVNETRLRIAVVYAQADQRRRVRDALVEVLADEAHERDLPALDEVRTRLQRLDDNDDLQIGPFSLRFVKPSTAELYLLWRNTQDAIEKWAHPWVSSFATNGAARVAAIIETDESAADDVRKKDGLADPKPVLRRYLASKSIATQFITSASAPQVKKGQDAQADDEFHEHAAANAVGDLLRSAGFFLRPFPEYGCGDGTLVIGVYGARLTGNTTRSGTSYVVNLVAVSIGQRDAWGFVDGQGWVSLAEATTSFLSSDQRRNSEREAKMLVERAVDSLYGRFGDRKIVLVFDAFGCRRFWPCLADKSDGKPEPWMTSHGKAVVRVRTATSEVLRPAGSGDWSESLTPATHTTFRLMELEGGEGTVPMYVLAGSAVMSRERGARESTRFAADPRNLRKDWHALGVTELQVLDAGPFDRENLHQQIGILCRIAPTWDRTLRWPSPLHLARAIVRDHPHGYFDEGEEAEEVEDNKQMRLDLGIW